MDFVRRCVQLSAQPAECHSIRFSVGQIEKPGYAWIVPRSFPVKLSSQGSFHRIFVLQKSLETLQRHFFKVHIRVPLVLWSEDPVIQIERPVYVRLHHAEARVSL